MNGRIICWHLVIISLRIFIVTQGVLNAMQPTSVKRSGYTVVVVGGVSKHYLWSDAQVLVQLDEIMRRHP